MRPSASPPDPDHLDSVLARSPLFGVLPPEGRAAVRDALQWCYLPGGEAVHGPGEPSDALYLVVHGRLRIYWDRDGSGAIEAHEIADEIEEGGVVGDVGMLSDEPHRGLVLAVRDTELGRLPEATFWALADRYPVLSRRLGYNAVQRLQSALRPPLEPHHVNVAVVPAHPDAPVRALTEALAAALGQFHPILYVNRERFDAALGAGSADDDVDSWDHVDRKVVSWICAQERAYRFILYEAGPADDAWTRRCIRMADRILIVGHAQGDSAPSEAERALALQSATSPLVGRELVLVHADSVEVPSGTARWLRDRAVDRVHHVRFGDPETTARLARFLAGRAVGVVLGGGGARGAAQIGAIAALLDAKVPIDFVGGTSAGGGVAAMVALGWDPARMGERYRKAFVGMAPFSHYTLPYYSMIRKNRVEEVARYLYGDARIEDLWIPLFCVSCDLVSGRMVLHRRGELWRAVLATSALPGVLPPVLLDGQLLVDGGVMDNNPVGPMRGLNRGPLVLIDVGQSVARLVDPPNLVHLPANFLALWHRFKPFGKRIRVPTIPEIVVRTMTVGRPDEGVVRMSDLYVRPAVDGFGLTDFLRQDELVTIGYNATMAALEAKAEDAGFLRRLGLQGDALKSLPRHTLPKPPASRV